MEELLPQRDPGIGRATAFAFAKLGANVSASGGREEVGTALASELQGLAVKAEFVKTDVTHEVEVRSLVKKSVSLFGKIDIAVNNAGMKCVPCRPKETVPSSTYSRSLGRSASLVLPLRSHQACGGAG